jgi:CO/xanthine dehydrogenase Mo-binding subunit
MAGQDSEGQCIVYLGASKAHNSQAMVLHIVAEVLGLKYTDVSLGEWANSDINFNSGSQGGSAHTGGAGSAFFRAALEMRNRLFERAITRSPFNDIDGITVDDLEAKNSEVFYKPDPTKKLTHAEIVSGWAPELVVSKGWSGSGTGPGDGIQRTKPGLPVEVGERVNTDCAAATCIELAVDPETGDVEILGVWNAIDTGYNVFAASVKGQIGAGLEVLTGQTMYYGDVYDPQTVAVLGMSFGSYMHPTSLDLNPDSFHGYAIENDDVAGPCGARGIGEPAITNASAVTCAVYNATGKWMDWEHGAGTADKILKAMGKA